jgi:hypothetical protein
MQGRLVLLAGLLAFSLALRADTDPFDGWTLQQLKAKVVQLQKENKDLKDKLAMAPAGSPADSSATAVAGATGDRLLDDFEGDQARTGQGWWTGADDNKLGTTLEPIPFVAEKGGSPLSPGHSGRIHGKMGAGHEPWPWANLVLAMDNEDLRPYSAISFYVKGDGLKHDIQLCKRSVKDFANFNAEFPTTKDWVKVTIKFSEFTQPSWGAQVPAVFDDVEKLQFVPGATDAAFDFSIDDLTLVK